MKYFRGEFKVHNFSYFISKNRIDILVSLKVVCMNVYSMFWAKRRNFEVNILWGVFHTILLRGLYLEWYQSWWKVCDTLFGKISFSSIQPRLEISSELPAVRNMTRIMFSFYLFVKRWCIRVCWRTFQSFIHHRKQFYLEYGYLMKTCTYNL